MTLQNRLVGVIVLAVTVPLVIVATVAAIAAPAWWISLLVVGVALVFGVGSVLLSASRVESVVDPVRELADRADRLAGGPITFTPLRTGMDEVDRIAAFYEMRSTELTRMLAAEREFASDASHQLRTPLTALLMRLEEISSADDLGAAQEEAQIGIAQVERLTQVVDELLARSRGTVDAPTNISLDSVIAALQLEWQPAFETARRSVLVSGERGLHVSATRVGLAQILATLLENALIHGAGTVEVRARRSGPSVVVEMSDMGIGVDPNLAPHIFERRVTTGGTGLGLALARDLAEVSGGRLELRNAQPAVFALFLSAATTD
ncbi:sensor histidine kinase KdpD [Allobranchiibius sp. CTAmp26]|uniref:sensor histidine kinase n=1 Tax=Allobranchiibius sp. CTAmp26 TaxID=2815214 RepID=UPI001AA1C16C|nr:HAMP domain-containing sensor histidine kinase [Allobranchiibius sp. CTAmp26]MBO1755650.1 HAMP domain-containing histidine kinase [Allobranchiibius sp. CTAmp26]